MDTIPDGTAQIHRLITRRDLTGLRARA